jgi:hypothetical protein
MAEAFGVVVYIQVMEDGRSKPSGFQAARPVIAAASEGQPAKASGLGA